MQLDTKNIAKLTNYIGHTNTYLYFNNYHPRLLKQLNPKNNNVTFFKLSVLKNNSEIYEIMLYNNIYYILVRSFYMYKNYAYKHSFHIHCYNIDFTKHISSIKLQYGDNDIIKNFIIHNDIIYCIGYNTLLLINMSNNEMKKHDFDYYNVMIVNSKILIDTDDIMIIFPNHTYAVVEKYNFDVKSECKKIELPEYSNGIAIMDNKIYNNVDDVIKLSTCMRSSLAETNSTIMHIIIINNVKYFLTSVNHVYKIFYEID